MNQITAAINDSSTPQAIVRACRSAYVLVGCSFSEQFWRKIHRIWTDIIAQQTRHCTDRAPIKVYVSLLSPECQVILNSCESRGFKLPGNYSDIRGHIRLFRERLK